MQTGELEEVPSGDLAKVVLAGTFLAQLYFAPSQMKADYGQIGLVASPKFHSRVMAHDCVDLAVDNLVVGHVPDFEVYLLDRDLTPIVLLVFRTAERGKEDSRLVLGDFRRVGLVGPCH